MSGHRFRITLAGAAVAALMVAAPALAGRRAPAGTRAGVFGPQAPRTLAVGRPPGSVAHSHSLQALGKEHQGEIGSHRVEGRYVLGFRPYWDPFWYPYPGWYYPAWGYPTWGWYGPRMEDHVPALEPAVPKGKALVALRVHPSRAEVFVDGTDRGRSNRFTSVRRPLWIEPGDHVVELRRKGYQDLRLDLHLEGGHAYTLRYDLTKGEGMDKRSS